MVIRSAWFRGDAQRAIPGVDQHVGRKLQQYRINKGLGPNVAAQAIGILPAQLALIEEGRRRISASQLFALAKLLDTPVSAFFDKREGTI